MAITKTNSLEKRAKRTAKLAASEKLTNGFMLALTYGLGAIILLEIIRRQYMVFMSGDLGARDFASIFSIVCGGLFAIAVAVTVILGCMKRISSGKFKTYTITFVISSLISFFLSFDVRLPISSMLLPKDGSEYAGVFNFLANLDLVRDAKMVEYGVVGFLVVAFVVYAIRLALLEKKK